HADGSQLRRALEGLARPGVRTRGEHGQAVLDVVEHDHDAVVLRHRQPGQGRGFGGLEVDIELAPAGREVVEPGHQQRTGRVRVAPDLPRLAQLQANPLAHGELVGRVRGVDLGEGAVLAAQVQLVVVEGDGAADELALVARGQVAPGADVERKSTRLNSSHVQISYAV